MLRPKAKMTVAECLQWLKPEVVENENRIQENKKRKTRRYYKRQIAELKTEKDWEEWRAKAHYANTRSNFRTYLRKLITLLFIAKYRNI